MSNETLVHLIGGVGGYSILAVGFTWIAVSFLRISDHTHLENCKLPVIACNVAVFVAVLYWGLPLWFLFTVIVDMLASGYLSIP